MKLSNHTTLITGAAGRIGSAIAKAALDEGASVILSDIAKIKLDCLAKELSDSHQSNRIHTIESDITTEEGITSLIKNAIKCCKTIDSSVHCAYPMSPKWGTNIENLEFNYLNQDIQNQLGVAIFYSKKIIEFFQKQGKGNLIHISSIQGVRAPKFDHYDGTNMVSPIEYAAIKAGIIAITKWLAKYFKSQDIRINCISPGGILDSQSQSFLNKYRQSCTNIGMLSANQVSGTAIFLLSKESIAINGQNLIVDDGWSL